MGFIIISSILNVIGIKAAANANLLSSAVMLYDMCTGIRLSTRTASSTVWPTSST